MASRGKRIGNMQSLKTKVAAEKAAQASQSSVQVVKDQLQNANDELKNLREKFHRENAKTQRKLSKAEKKAKRKERGRQEGIKNKKAAGGRVHRQTEKHGESRWGKKDGEDAPKPSARDKKS